jgi:hypothetical protein
MSNDICMNLPPVNSRISLIHIRQQMNIFEIDKRTKGEQNPGYEAERKKADIENNLLAVAMLKKSNNRLRKKWANRIKGGAGVAKTATTQVVTAHVAGYSAGAAIMGGGTLSTGGIALVVVGAGMTLSSAGLAVRSYSRTKTHIEQLEIIQNNFAVTACQCSQHVGINNKLKASLKCTVLLTRILPYLIVQKRNKKLARGVKASVVGAPIAALAAGANALYKYKEGIKGEARRAVAMFLIRQLLTSKCTLAEAIVAELLSMDEVKGIQYHCTSIDSIESIETVVEIVKNKIQSV